MRVVIVGIGEVGEHIAANLAEDHEVVAIDTDPDRVSALRESLDILAVHGTGASIATLEEAGIEQADLVIASTDDDEANLVICSTVKAVTDVFTIARVKDVLYLRTWETIERVYGVDFMVCTNWLAAREIAQIVELPAARDVEPFADGVVQMVEIEIEPESNIVGKTVQEADQWGSLTFAAFFRDDEVVIPRGDTVIEAGDKAVLIGSAESIRSAIASITPGEVSEIDDVVVIGGSTIGFHVAQLLEAQGDRLRLVERSPERANELARELPHTIVFEHDAFDLDFLDRERIGEADAVVAALENDQQNLMISLLVQRLGVERTVAVVEEEFSYELFEAVGVDVAVNPRLVAAEEIIKYTFQRSTEKLTFLENDRAEVLEFEIDAESLLADRSIETSVRDLPASVVIGAITRDGELVVPRGETVVEVGDHVVVFVEVDDVAEVTAKI